MTQQDWRLRLSLYLCCMRLEVKLKVYRGLEKALLVRSGTI
jgi:hypothetical protein